MRRTATLALLLTFAAGTRVLAAAPPAGYDFCTTCHGADGGGNLALQAPALAGIEPWYLASRLQAYRDALRGPDYSRDPAGAEMRTALRDTPLSRQAAVATRIGALRGTAVHVRPGGDAAQGRLLYAQHCAACHGSDGEGIAALQAPGLRRLNDWYLVAAWGKYLSGARGEGPDLPAVQMRAAAQATPDLDIRGIAAWLTALPGGSPP